MRVGREKNWRRASAAFLEEPPTVAVLTHLLAHFSS